MPKKNSLGLSHARHPLYVIYFSIFFHNFHFSPSSGSLRVLPPLFFFFLCQTQSEAHNRPSAMAVIKMFLCSGTKGSESNSTVQTGCIKVVAVVPGSVRVVAANHTNNIEGSQCLPRVPSKKRQLSGDHTGLWPHTFLAQIASQVWLTKPFLCKKK